MNVKGYMFMDVLHLRDGIKSYPRGITRYM